MTKVFMLISTDLKADGTYDIIRTSQPVLYLITVC